MNAMRKSDSTQESDAFHIQEQEVQLQELIAKIMDAPLTPIKNSLSSVITNLESLKQDIPEENESLLAAILTNRKAISDTPKGIKQELTLFKEDVQKTLTSIFEPLSLNISELKSDSLQNLAKLNELTQIEQLQAQSLDSIIRQQDLDFKSIQQKIDLLQSSSLKIADNLTQLSVFFKDRINVFESTTEKKHNQTEHSINLLIEEIRGGLQASRSQLILTNKRLLLLSFITSISLISLLTLLVKMWL